MLLKFLSFCALITYNLPLVQAKASILRLGKNPLDSFYRLPDGAVWNGKGDFTWTHYLIEPDEQPEYCEQNGNTEYCIREARRQLLVEGTGIEFPSHCWYEDCYIGVTIPDRTEDLVYASNITEAPFTNFDSPPFYPQRICHGSKVTMLAPGNRRYNLKHYNLYLLIDIINTTTSNGRVDVKERRIKSLIMLENDRCDSFVTHKYKWARIK